MKKPKKETTSWKRRTAVPLSVDGVEASKIILEDREEAIIAGTKSVLKKLLGEVSPDNIHGEVSTVPAV